MGVGSVYLCSKAGEGGWLGRGGGESEDVTRVHVLLEREWGGAIEVAQ